MSAFADHRVCLVPSAAESIQHQLERERGSRRPDLVSDDYRAYAIAFAASAIDIEQVKDLLWEAARRMDDAGRPLLVGYTITVAVPGRRLAFTILGLNTDNTLQLSAPSTLDDDPNPKRHP